MNNSDFSLYIHIPFCISKCKYCDFFSITKDKIENSYIDALCNEITFYEEKYHIREWKTVYIGGGTPSLLTEDQLNNIFQTINKEKLNHCEEITIEVNPDDITEEYLKVLLKTPVNRLSCGIQSLNEESLKFVNRRANLDANLSAIEIIKKIWSKEKSFDLICGLPEENENSFMKGLRKLISYQPDHISMYCLSVEEETPLGEMIYSNKINYDFDFADDLWLKGKRLLIENGYLQYEISNFARNGKESKHNLVYWNHGNYIGCGCGATGTVYKEDGSGTRWTNKKNIEDYVDFWLKEKSDKQIKNIEEIDVKTSIFEFFMMGLRKEKGISDTQFYNIFRQRLPEQFLTVFYKWKLKQLADIKRIDNENFYFLNEKGRDFLNRFLEELDL